MEAYQEVFKRYEKKYIIDGGTYEKLMQRVENILSAINTEKVQYATFITTHLSICLSEIPSKNRFTRKNSESAVTEYRARIQWFLWS